MLNKRKLSHIERAEATAEMIDVSQRLTVKWIVTAELVDKKKILLLNFFRVKDLKGESKKAVIRTFLSKNDYITQDLSVSNVKWLTSAFHNMNKDIYYGVWTPEGSKVRDSIYINSTAEKDLISNFFKEYPDENVWNSIYKFQIKVMNERLNKKHKKETDEIDKVMKTVKPVPKKLINWIKNVKLPKYLVYESISKVKIKCECTYCKSKMVVYKKSLSNLKNNNIGICPQCGKEVTYKAKGRLACSTNYRNYVAYIEPTKNGFIMRYFHIIRNLHRSGLKIDDYILEECRSFYCLENGKLKLDKSYEWTTYKNTSIRWCNDTGKINCGYGFLYGGNLPKAWQHTPMKYSSLEYLQEKINLSKMINRFTDFPKLELIIKMGLFDIAKQCINNGISYYENFRLMIDKDGKSIFDILMLDKINVKLLQTVNGDNEILTLLQASQRNGFRFSVEQLKNYHTIYGNNTELLNEVGRKNATLHKIMKYIDKESVKYPNLTYSCNLAAIHQYTEKNRQMAHDWVEYVGWCEVLQYDLSNMFIYMPTNFLKVHDRTAKEYQAFREKEEEESKKRYNNIIKKMKEKSTQIPVFNIHKNGLFIKFPDNSDEIKKEGAYLHHCVGSYVNKVAKGETIILFIRKESEPDKPYYTMEWKGKVIQCRGKNNCDMTNEVRKFVNEFTKEMTKYDEQTRERTAS